MKSELITKIKEKLPGRDLTDEQWGLVQGMVYISVELACSCAGKDIEDLDSPVLLAILSSITAAAALTIDLSAITQDIPDAF